MLGGRSVNGLPILFPYDNALPYHLYWQVLNAKKHGVPQNRERVFLIGIRDDKDNNFRFPAEEHLSKRLKDVLEEEVDDKYFLSDVAINGILNTKFQTRANLIQEKEYVDCLMACDYKSPKAVRVKSATSKGYEEAAENNSIKIGTWRTHKDGQGFREIEDGNCPTIPARAREDGSGQPVIQVKSATSKGYEEATEGDSINFSVPNSETRRGRVGKGVAQTLDTGCNQGVIYNDKRLNETISKNTLKEGEIKMLDTYNKSIHDECPTLKARENDHLKLSDGYKIRRLTPRECFRLMDFPDTFTWDVSDSQAYKQAGNSIVVRVLEKIIKNLLQI